MGNKDWQNTSVSKTVQRPPAVCRVVVQVEVELSKEMMEAGRLEHDFDSTSILNKLFRGAQITQMATAAETLDELRHEGDLTILSSTVEAMK